MTLRPIPGGILLAGGSGNQALPAHRDGEQAAHRRLQQANGLLPPHDVDDGGRPRGAAHLDAT